MGNIKNSSLILNFLLIHRRYTNCGFDNRNKKFDESIDLSVLTYIIHYRQSMLRRPSYGEYSGGRNNVQT
jgi:hypothetical protein